MDLPEEELRAYYRGVAKSLIKDGVTGFTEDELTEKLLSDHPDNPFRPLSESEILEMLEKSYQQYREGKCRPFKEAIEEERRKGGFCRESDGKSGNRQKDNNTAYFEK